MKRALSILLAIVLVLSMTLMGNTVVLSEQSGDFDYTISNSCATITGYTGAGGVVNIPDTLGGYSVTSIGAYAFSWCSGLTGVTIPDSVTSIGENAFYGTQIANPIITNNTLWYVPDTTGDYTVPDGVEIIANSVFAGSSLKSIIMPNTSSIIRT